MSQIEMITALPDWKWKEHSANEIAMTGEELVEVSNVVWQVGNVAVAGFIYSSFTSPPWMWFLLGEGIRIADLIDFRRQAEQIPTGTTTAVEASFEVGLKFAKIYGFVETGVEEIQQGRRYKIMRKI